MTQERLSVRTIREILRLKYENHLSNRAIARACRVSNSTVGDYLARYIDIKSNRFPVISKLKCI